MAVKFSYPWLGIAVPVLAIAGLCYPAHYFVFSLRLSLKDQIWFEVWVTLLWISYLLAIVVGPGTPSKSYTPAPGEPKRWCRRCQTWKPERTHHCRSCKRCVLRMDHHCPWTMQCVGNNNTPHFYRFLLCIEYVSGWGFYHLCCNAIMLFKNRNKSLNLIPTSLGEIAATLVCLGGSFLVCATIALLLIRCIWNIFDGQTQIEHWEKERIEDRLTRGRLLAEDRRYGHLREEPAKEKEEEQDDGNNKSNALQGVQDIGFPYDIDPFANFYLFFGNPLYCWWLPWAGPTSDGYHFEHNEQWDPDHPWPPTDSELTLPPKAAPGSAEQESQAPGNDDIADYWHRDQWANQEGEQLEDFGVDVSGEEDDSSDTSESSGASYSTSSVNRRATRSVATD